jgi:hypothetical protein
MSAVPSVNPIQTPCTGICRLGAGGLCEGCLRTSQEIGAWAAMEPAERERIMREVLPQRLGPHRG